MQRQKRTEEYFPMLSRTSQPTSTAQLKLKFAEIELDYSLDDFNCCSHSSQSTHPHPLAPEKTSSILLTLRKIRENILSQQLYDGFAFKVHYYSVIAALRSRNYEEFHKCVCIMARSVCPNLEMDDSMNWHVEIDQMDRLFALNSLGLYINGSFRSAGSSDSIINDTLFLNYCKDEVMRMLFRAFMMGDAVKFWKLYNSRLDGDERLVLELNCLKVVQMRFASIMKKAFHQLSIPHVISLVHGGGENDGQWREVWVDLQVEIDENSGLLLFRSPKRPGQPPSKDNNSTRPPRPVTSTA